MARLARFVAGRRTKWVVLAFWVIFAFAMSPLGAKIADVTDDSFSSQLPKDAQSTKVLELQKDRFASGETSTGLIVYEREGGLTPADRRKIAADVQAAKQVLGKDLKRTAVPFTDTGEGLVSRDGELAYTVLAVPSDFEALADQGKDLRERVGDGGGGLAVYVSGSIGISADFEEVFGDIDGRLLLATVLLVLILLFAIYRSLVLPFIPIVVVGMAYAIAQAFVYLYAEAGQSVTGNVRSILPVLMFGVGTDYALLLVSRYREELHRFEDKHEAMQRALERSGPAIIASGLTVIASMLVLVIAEVGGVKALGPASAIGVACALLASITLLPALLAIFGRVAFWPRRRLVAYDPEHEMATPRGIWRRLGDRVLHRPGLALGFTVLLFGAMSLGLLAYEENYSTTSFFKKPTESVDGFKALEKHVPAGAIEPTTVLVTREGGSPTPQDLAAVTQRIEGVDGIASVAPGEQSSDGSIASLNVIFDDDPYTAVSLERVPTLRERVEGAAPGAVVLVGGGTATQYDFDEANATDLQKIVPIALLVIALILGVLLRAVVAPIVLIGSVILSFFGTLGLSILFFRFVVGDEGVDASLPTFAFIFLVALGVDYTIFLMSRVREEAAVYGTREGVLRALTATGPVITSAGIILAGTFSVLMTFPVSFAFNIGFMVAVGILLDTFVVRTIMVPAAVELIGDKIWWPSTAEGGGGALRERTSETHQQVRATTEPLPAPE